MTMKPTPYLDDFQKVGGSQVDGRRGDNSVTFKIHVPAGDIEYTGAGAMGGQTGHFIRMDLGSLNGYAGAGAVTVGCHHESDRWTPGQLPDDVWLLVEGKAMVPAVVDDPDTNPDETAPCPRLSARPA